MGAFRFGLVCVCALATPAVAEGVPPADPGGASTPFIAPGGTANVPGEAIPDTNTAAVLPAKSTIYVTLDQGISTQTNVVGDTFSVTVALDVTNGDTVVIPKGTPGTGEVTFLTKKGGFGKPGIVGIALRHLGLGGKQIALDGRYREEGKNGADAAAATFFTVGILAAVVHGKPGEIPHGRLLKARTGEDFAFTRAAATLPAPLPPVEARAEPASAAQPPSSDTAGEPAPEIADKQPSS